MLSKLMTAPKLRADFNGLFGDILCLSHSDICVDEHGVVIQLHVGMIATAFDEDLNANGIRDDLIANGRERHKERIGNQQRRRTRAWSGLVISDLYS